MDKKISEVGDEDIGVLIPVPGEDELVEKFYVELVELARKNNFDIIADVWEADKSSFLDGTATEEMLEDLAIIADFSLQFLEDEVSEGFFIEYQSGVGIVLGKET